MIRVLVVDDSEMIRKALKVIIEQDPEIKVVGLAANGQEAIELCNTTSPDLVLLDIKMPICNGVAGTKLIKTRNDAIKVLILTTFDDQQYITAAMKNGADGYILKDIGDEDLIAAIKSTMKGFSIVQQSVFNTLKSGLADIGESRGNISVQPVNLNITNREQDIIQLIVDGSSNKEIAAHLGMAEGTVRNVISGLLLKFELSDRTQLAVFAIKNNLV